MTTQGLGFRKSIDGRWGIERKGICTLSSVVHGGGFAKWRSSSALELMLTSWMVAVPDGGFVL